MIFFARLDHDSGRGVDTVTPSLRHELTAAGIPAAGQDPIIAGLRACVRDRSAATDPTAVPPSCRPGQPRLREVLTRAGVRANAHNFARTFSVTLWYAVGILVVVFLGMFVLPRRVRVSAFEAEMSAREPEGTGRTTGR